MVDGATQPARNGTNGASVHDSLLPEPAKGASRGGPNIIDLAAMSLWMGGIHLTALLIAVSLCGLPSTWSITLIVLLVTLVAIPIFEDSAFTHSIARFICKRAMAYFPISVIVEDDKALQNSSPCILAIEPHSILPIGTIAMCQHTGVAPLPRLRCGATSAIFTVPFVRHLWSWLGLMPATKKGLKSCLQRGDSIGLVPGGVQECLYLEKGSETIYLKQRRGFVRLAIEERTALVPVFIFGQTTVYNWWKPSGTFYSELSRRLGFTPLIFWGLFGSPIPLPQPMTVVIGKPIPSPAPDKKDGPSKDQVDAHLTLFIAEMERIFSKYKGQAGYKDLTLRVI